MIYRFGQCELDVDAGELRRGDEPQAIQAKPFLLLVLLVRNAGRVVSKDEIFDSLWRGTSVNEASLRRLLKEVRRAVGDDGDRQAVLRTVRGQGYRFVAEVEVFPQSRDVGRDEFLGSDPAFIGRSEALAAGRRVLDRARAGRGQQLLFAGQAGLGKSRLLRELQNVASHSGFEVFWGKSFEQEGGPTYHMWRPILRGVIEQFGLATVQSLLGRAASDLQLIDPSVVLVGSAGVRGFELSASDDEAAFKLAESMERLLKKLARLGPILLIFDDLHASDLGSLRLLTRVSRACTDAPIAFLGSYRPFEVHQSPDRDRALGELQRVRADGLLTLGSLSRDEVKDFVESRTGKEPSDERVDQFEERSGGNPFLLGLSLEVQSSIQMAPTASASFSGVRDSPLQNGILTLLASCSPTTRRTLEIAAVIGRDFTLGLLLSVSDLSRGAVLLSLDEAEAAGLVQTQSKLPGTYRFLHMLIAEGLYEILPPAKRRELHARLGAAYEALSDSVLEPRQALIAHHYFRAGPDLYGRAISFSLNAGRSATQRGDPEEAVLHFERAVSALRETQGAGPELIDAMVDLGTAQTRAQNTVGARESLMTAAGLARSAGEAQRFAEAALAYANEVSVGSYQPESVALLEEGLEFLDGSEMRSPLYAGLLGRLANARSLRDEPELRAARAREAVSIARTTEDLTALAATLKDYHFCLMGVGSASMRRAIADELYDLSASLRSAPFEMWALKYRTESALEDGATSELQTCCRIFDKQAHFHRMPFFLCHAFHHDAMLALREGRLEEVEALAGRGLELGMRSGNQIVVQFFGVQLWSLKREQGRLAELESQVEVLIRDHPDDSGWYAARAYDQLQRGDEGRARMAFEDLVDNELSASRRSTNWSTTPALLAEMAARLGDPERSRRLYEELEAHADKNVIVSVSMSDFGPVHRFLGLCASNFDPPRARRHLERAVFLAERQRLGPALARAQIDLAGLIIADDRDRALDLAGKAARASERMGAGAVFSAAKALIEA